MSKAPLLSVRGQIGPYGKHHPHLGTVIFTTNKRHGHLYVTGEVKASEAVKTELAKKKPALDDVVPRLQAGARPIVHRGRMILPKFGTRVGGAIDLVTGAGATPEG